MNLKRILVADDEEVIRLIIRLALGRGYEIVEARDGEEAWKVFDAAEPPFELVIVDLKMPRLSGDEVLARIQERRPNTPAILLTGDLEAATGSRPDVRIMTKPFDNSALAATVEQLLELAARNSG